MSAVLACGWWYGVVRPEFGTKLAPNISNFLKDCFSGYYSSPPVAIHLRRVSSGSP